MSLVRVAVDGEIGTLTLDNPPLNLVTIELIRELSEALERLAREAGLRALVVTGAGERAFCGGSDIREFPDLMEPGAVVPRKSGPENRAYSALAHFPRPTVAALQASAVGGGLELALCCDLIVAAENATLSFPEVTLGVFPGSGGPVRAARRIGAGRTRQMMLLARPVDARTALSWGLVDSMAPPGGALEEATQLARRLAGLPPEALALCREAIRAALDLDEESALQRSLELTARAFSGEEIREGVRAFLARKKPRRG